MSTITAGYDFFETIPGETNFQFPHGLAIPADFFDKGSAPFTGTIRFEGVPIREWAHPASGKNYKMGTTDTIVERKHDVTIKIPYPGSGTTAIELVRLSLRSCPPIEVHVGLHVQLWDVYVSLSRSKPSIGTMTITQTSDNGGHFATELAVAPHFRFERRSDGEERLLDMGALRIPNEKQALAVRLTTLQASEVPWQQSPLERENVLAIPELTGRFVVPAIMHSHGVRPALLQ